MNITYDKKVDAMYIRLNEKLVYESCKKITEDINVDYTKDGQDIGIEVHTASKNTILPIKATTIPIEFTPIAA